MVSLILLVEDAAVGDHDDRIECRGAVLLQPDQLVRQPGDGIALAAACGVLDEVAPARAMLGGRPQAGGRTASR